MWTELIDFVTLTKHHLNIVLNKFRLNYTRAEKPAGGQRRPAAAVGRDDGFRKKPPAFPKLREIYILSLINHIPNIVKSKGYPTEAKTVISS